MLLCYTIFLFGLSKYLVLPEVITLAKDKNVTCVLTGDSIYSAIFVASMINNKLSRSFNNLIQATWINSDWEEKQSTKSSYSFVTDLRWENFKLDLTSGFFVAKNSVPFSICSSFNITYTVKDGNFLGHKKHHVYLKNMTSSNSRSDSCRWSHYTAFRENESSLVIQAEENINTTINFEEPVEKFYLSDDSLNNENHYRKRHTYHFNESVHISNTSSTISNINFTKNACVSMFISLEEDCYLNITLTVGDKMVTKCENGFYKRYELKRWKRIQIEIDDNGLGEIQFFRWRKDEKTSGYWAIDSIQHCRSDPEQTHLIIPENSLISDPICKTLDRKRNQVFPTFCNKPDFVGSNCAVNCSQILGTSYKNCENHRICLENENCVCAWDYQPPLCTKKCKNGFTGLNCYLQSLVTEEISEIIHTTPSNDSEDKNINNSATKTISSTVASKVTTDTIDITSDSTEKAINNNCSEFKNELAVTRPTEQTTKITEESENIENVSANNNDLVVILLIIACILLICNFVAIICWYRQTAKAPDSGIELQFLHTIKSKNSYLVKVTDLELYFKQAVEEGNLKHQFESLAETDFTAPCLAGLLQKNFNKNRNRNYLPYDRTRVILKDMEGIGTGDYINASFIDGLLRPKTYIACQGPKFSTVRDFWRMIFQEHVETIVMASDFIEDKKRKCAEYWPPEPNTLFECGEIVVKLIKETKYEFYETRVFEVYYMSHRREVFHIQLKWNSQQSSFPNHIIPVVKIVREKIRNTFNPVVIHSGCGITRTGTLILCDLALSMAELHQNIDFYSLLENMRKQRPKMIENLEQYILAHLIVMECLTKDDLFENVHNRKIDSNLIELQLKHLEKVCWHDRILKSFPGYVTNKNTFPGLNLLEVQMYRTRRNNYVVMKQPSEFENDLENFWWMVGKQSYMFMLFLNKSKKVGKPLWPYKSTDSKIGIHVRCLSVAESPHATLSVLSLLIYEKASKKIIYDSLIYFFELEGWEPEYVVPKSTVNLLNIVKDIIKLGDTQKTILVACRDGTTACGIFVVLSYIIEKYEEELEMDVYNAIRIARRSDSSLVNNFRQLKFIYSCISNYIHDFERYTQIEESYLS